VTTSNDPPRPDTPRRLLLVHAHPDDETINNGATMAKYVAEGVQVTLVTCTRGERGEVIGDRLARLARPDAGSDELGDHRVGELASAMAALGVTDHRFLGDPTSPGRRAGEVLADGGIVYRDSGMAYDHEGGVVPAPDQSEGAFAPVSPADPADPTASVERPAEELAELIRQLRPQVVVTYEPGGGYGHPDHVQAHLVTMRAVELAALIGPPVSSSSSSGVDSSQGQVSPAWTVPKVYWVVMPESLVRATLGAIATAEGEDYQGLDPAGRMPSQVVPDNQVSAAIDAIAFTGAKVAALRAHETQVSVSADGAFYALSNGVRRPVLGLEFYRLVRGVAAGPRDDVGREIDLFAGT
jgi:N-acetyl-1-D-myo-inositol-2-amino-2-deoxy-alpha-D-glucopyranoside deacetylase